MPCRSCPTSNGTQLPRAVQQPATGCKPSAAVCVRASHPASVSSRGRVMSRFSITPIIAAEDNRLSHAEFRLLAIIGGYSDSKTGWCFPSMETLAKKMECLPRQVRKHISKLTELGYIERRIDPGKGAKTRIVMDFDDHVLEGPQTPVAEGPPSNDGKRPTPDLFGDVTPVAEGPQGEVVEGHVQTPVVKGPGGRSLKDPHNVPSNEPIKTSSPLSPKSQSPKRQGRRKTMWPDGFSLTPQLRAYAEQQSPGIDADRDFEKFRTFHQAKGSMFVSWNRAWQTWCLNDFAKPMKGKPNGSSQPLYQNRVDDNSGYKAKY